MSLEDKLTEAVKSATGEREGRRVLQCSDAFQVAERLGADLLDIARICNRHQIKIVRCQLGCFK